MDEPALAAEAKVRDVDLLVVVPLKVQLKLLLEQAFGDPLCIIITLYMEMKEQEEEEE